MIKRAIQFIKFWFKLLTDKNYPRVRWFDPEDLDDHAVDGYINIEYMGVVNEAGLHMPAHKYTLTFQRNPKAKLIARNLYNFGREEYPKDIQMALKKMREDIYVYYTKLERP